MNEGKHHRRWRRRWRKVVHGGTTRLRKPPRAALPPAADESRGLAAPAILGANGGVLRANKSDRLPAALAEASEHDEYVRNSWMPGRLVTTITLLALAFIAIITWFISHMPNR